MTNLNKDIIFKSFAKETYHKSEILTELLQLQSEVVNYVMPINFENIQTAKLYDVERYLETKNEEIDYKASKELQIFKEGCDHICNQIKAIISGQNGEKKAFSYLNRINTKNIVLKNIELKDENDRTELDAVVITEKRIFIIEVKNTKRDIFIDENGNYYRTGKFLNWDSNILQKMDTKERLLRNALESTDLKDIKIERLLVFTNNRVRVENTCNNITTTFLPQLPYIIDRTIGCKNYTSDDMDNIRFAIDQFQNPETYELDFDVNEFKVNLIKLMEILNHKEQENTNSIGIFLTNLANRIDRVMNKLFDNKSYELVNPLNH